MKNKFLCKKNLISSCVVMMCMAFAVLFTAFEADASDEIKEVKYVENYTYTAAQYVNSETGEKIAPTVTGYLFAGWYTYEKESDLYHPVSSPKENATYYAKFVPEEVLGIRAQVSAELFDANTENDGLAAIRFITSLDNSLNYQHVGFNIKKSSNGTPEDAATTKYVYENIYALSASGITEEAEKYEPKEVFHSASHYLKTWTIANITDKAYNTDVTVVPYWITLDGTRVEGTKAIKTVNLGRSWVYIDENLNATDGEKYGTYRHPFTSLEDALNEIVLDEGGKIVIKTDSTITLDKETFTWKEHGKDLTVCGQTGSTETLDFSAFENFRMGDSVTFENMTLILPTKQLYADGHRFKIAEKVVSDNSGVIIFGGGNSNDVTGDTSVTLLSGSYNRVYGGGLNGDVDGNTHVTLENVDIYDTSSNQTRFVFGGGRNANVTGNTYVTVGEGFNSEHDWQDHGYLSAVFGGGHGSSGNIATVEKNTYVVVKDGAKTNYVHGAGMSYSEVKGTSHVTFDGGYAMSVYGGGSSVQAVNASTYVEMKAGTVEQIFGGNPSNSSMGMTGNTDVRILGGKILRRVYAGCYNEYKGSWGTENEVNGYASVTFGPDTYATLATSYSDGDCAYLASSRYNNTVNETGVFIVNDYNVDANATNVGMVGHSTDFTNIKKYNYLVKATEGGAVYSEGGSLRVIPDPGKVATVRVNSPEENDENVHAYITSEGLCKLPTLDSSGKTNVYVVFTDAKPDDVELSKYEATANGTHYETLEEAISVANTLSTTTEKGKAVVVSVLKNAEIEETLNIVESANIVIQNADSVTTAVNRADNLTGISLLNVAKGAKVTVNGITLDGRASSEIAAGTTELTNLTKGSVSLVTVSGEADFTNATIQYTYTSKEGAGVYIENNGNVTMRGGTISNNYVTNGSGGAVSVTSGTFTMEDGTISNNTASASGGAFIVRNGSQLIINKGTISGNKALTSSNNGGGAIFQHTNTTVNINGGTITKNASSYHGGAIYMNCNANNVLTIQKGVEISKNSSEQAGGGVYTKGAGIFTMTGGSITANTAKVNGNGVYVGENTTFTMSGGSIFGHGTENTPNSIAGNAVYVAANAVFNMSEDADISYNYSTARGNGVYVATDGSFTMSGGKIRHNHTTNTGSGVDASGSFTMKDGTISNNFANKSAGGVIIRSSGTFSMEKGTIENNTATENGGGIYIQTSTTEKINITGGTIQNNTAKLGGGIFVSSNSVDIKSYMKDDVSVEGNTATKGAGVYIEKGTLEMTGGSITGHGTSEKASAAEGAGVYVAATNGKFNLKGDGTISNNHTTGNGAGVATYGVFNMSETSTIQNNTTTGNGGGVYVGGGTYTLNNTATQTIYNNQAVNGGGVAITGTFNFKRGNIIDNTATTNGGGTYVDGGTFTMTDETHYNPRIISYNEANSGAGVYVNSGEFTMTKGTIERNVLPTTGSVYGAGVYLNAGTFNLSGGSICKHGEGDATKVTTRGAYEGAGICAAGTSVVDMSGGTVSNNYVNGSGAGVAIRDTAKFIMSDGTISDNTAGGAGGAIIVRSTRKETVEEQEILEAAFVMNDGKISGNSALRDDGNGGGAIFQSKNTRIEIYDGTISGNRSSYNGGAIFANAGSDDDNALFLIAGGTITQNTAANCGAGVYVNSGICNMTGGTISEHGNKDTSTSGAVNGAGVYVAGTFNMSEEATITNNYTSGSGAGVYVAGTFNMNGGTISSNKSTGDGAGVYLAENIGMKIDGGKIINNTTSGNGGAIAGVGNNEIQLTSGEISGNTGKIVQGIFLTMVTNGTQVIMDVGFNMGTNDIRFNNVSNTEPILKFVGGTTLSHYTTDNKLQIGLHNGSKTGSALFECESNEAATNIIELLNSNNTSSNHNNNNKWSFSVDGLNIKVAK